MESTSKSKSFTLPPLNHGRRETASNDSSLVASSYDGSHLSWQDFRSIVLAPYGIDIISQPPKNRLPFELSKLIEARSQSTTRFDEQKKDFRNQVTTGRGFGPSPLFPPNLLPPLDKTPGLARCMIPRFGREPLPERASGHTGPLYELCVPHPGLASGYAQNVFDSQEWAMLPHYLSVGGTNVNFETGYVTSNETVHCPFLTFERVAGATLEHLEMANNQCAIAGSWCIRAVHNLYNKAYKTTVIPDLPTAFSCIINNSFAILNYHWIDHAQEYCMAPLCKFDLKNDAHFTKFLIWIEAIGDWGLRFQLPRIKSALSRLIQFSPTPTVTSIPSLTLSPISNSSSESGIVRALRSEFDNIPWRLNTLNTGEYTPITSSTADWGSPRNFSDGFTPISRTSTHSWGSPCDDSPNFPYPSGPNMTMLRNPELERMRGLQGSMSSKRKPKPTVITSPPPLNPTKTLQRRLAEAQDEIRDLRTQLQQQRVDHEDDMTSLRNEMSSVKELLFTLLRKENAKSRVRSQSMPPISPSNPSPQVDSWSPNQAPLSFVPRAYRRVHPQNPRQGCHQAPESESSSAIESELESEMESEAEEGPRTAEPISAVEEIIVQSESRSEHKTAVPETPDVDSPNAMTPKAKSEDRSFLSIPEVESPNAVTPKAKTGENASLLQAQPQMQEISQSRHRLL